MLALDVEEHPLYPDALLGLKLHAVRHAQPRNSVVVGHELGLVQVEQDVPLQQLGRDEREVLADDRAHCGLADALLVHLHDQVVRKLDLALAQGVVVALTRPQARVELLRPRGHLLQVEIEDLG